jgi:predicted lipoprotein with Yx(FWY)xxD motif
VALLKRILMAIVAAGALLALAAPAAHAAEPPAQEGEAGAQGHWVYDSDGWAESACHDRGELLASAHYCEPYWAENWDEYHYRLYLYID